MFPEQSTQTETFVRFLNQDQAAIGSYSGSLKTDTKKLVEAELKRLLLGLTTGYPLFGAAHEITHLNSQI